MFHVKQRQHELSATQCRPTKNNDVFTPTLPLGQNKRSFSSNDHVGMTRSKPAFPATAIWIIPIRPLAHSSVHCVRQRLSLLRHARTTGYARQSISRLDPHPVSCAGRMSGLRGPPRTGPDIETHGQWDGSSRSISRASSTRRIPIAGLEDFPDLRNVLDSLREWPGKSDIRASGMPTTKHVIKAGGHGPWHRMAIFVSRETSRLNTANTGDQKYKTGVSFRPIEPHRSRRENATIQRLNTFG